MGVRHILETLRDNIAESASLKTYCQVKYNKDQTVFLGLNRQSPPDVEKSPLIIIPTIGSEIVVGNKKIYKVLIGYCVFNETLLTTENKNTYEGFILSEELREKTEIVILGLRKDLGKINLESETMENKIFPQFTTCSYVLIEQINTSRS